MLDLVIIGGSAAGGSAAIYAARRKLNFTLISEDFGGEMARSGEVNNYPGFPESDGITLTEKWREHLKANDCEPELNVRVEDIAKQEDGSFKITAKKNGEEVVYETRTVIIATGVHPRHLNVPGEEALVGRGVTYCTTCDGPLYRGKRTVTVGGGNSAMESALMLQEIADEVTLVNKNGQFKGEKVLIDKVEQSDKITVIYNAMTQSIEGEPTVQKLTYTDESGATQEVETDGVFVHIGLIPNSSLAPEAVEKNNFGEIVVNMRCETNIEGLYAAGDVTNVPYKQIAIASGQGVVAALSAIEYINKL